MNNYSEEAIVQVPALDLLGSLGWEIQHNLTEEKLGEDGTLGRKSFEEVVLFRDLKKVLLSLNPWLDEYGCEQVMATLTESVASDLLIQRNEKKYQLFRDGVPVQRARQDGSLETIQARIFDFEYPENNHFFAVTEFWVHGANGYHRRCDLVGFVNGIPLMFAEFKRPDKPVEDAYNDNYSDYLQTIPQLFEWNAFLILSNGVRSKVGTLGSPFEFFHEWKRLKEGEKGSVELETMLKGIGPKNSFMDLFENFIVFDHSVTPAAKILARNHQYLGVNEAVAAYKDRSLNAGKLGVFWHTQGSGKSYSMVFFARKVRRKFAGSPTILVVTDREELDSQIASTFANCGCTGGLKGAQLQATSAEDLKQRLLGNPGFIFTLIQKFNDDRAEPIVPDHDIIILSDEAHRSNNGIFADNMCRMLPTASRLGFTGTPIFSYDNITERTFGGYVSIYDFKDAIDDGATVPLFYENRSDLLKITNPEINEKLAEIVEQADLEEKDHERLERDMKRELHIITAEKRLKTIAKDFVEHYASIWQSGKAMFVCIDKVTTVRMFNYVQQFWQEKIAGEKQALKSDSQQEALERQRKIAWMESTEMAVVISQEQNEIDTFKKWGLDIIPHRKKMATRSLDEDFKKPDHPFRVVFVCAMWLTGFDVKSLSVMYLDKPMKAHSLMQAIARANRVNDGKSNGLIIDYIGIVQALRKALAEYTRDGEGEEQGKDPVSDLSVLLGQIEELIQSVRELFAGHGVDFEKLLNASGFEKAGLVVDAAEAMAQGDDLRKRFNLTARKLSALFKYFTYEQLPQVFFDQRNAINAVYNYLNREPQPGEDLTALTIELQQVVDDYIVVEKPSGNAEATPNKQFNIGNIDFDRLRAVFEKTSHKHLVFKDVREAIEQRLKQALADNPTLTDYYQRYESIIEAYNQSQDPKVIAGLFAQLVTISSDLNAKDREHQKLGLSPQQGAVFDMLVNNVNLDEKNRIRVSDFSKELTDSVQQRIAEMSNWTEKPDNRASVSVLINEMLYTQLPEDSYPDNVLEGHREQLFQYFFTRSGGPSGQRFVQTAF